jgi:soluble lytic murein transglycosylase-like protein
MFQGWGSAHYETPSPTPAPAPTTVASAVSAPATTKVRKPAHERAARVRKHDASQIVAAHDDPPAPLPTAAADPAKPGPIEQGAPTIRDLVTKHARANGVPETLAAAVVNIESRFNPQARGGSALGLMQIKYDTARSMGYAGGVTALMVPDTNLHFGMKVLADAYKASHGDICMTLARYQSGHRVTHASAANRAYCAKAKTYMARAS